jgi:inosose dehydratase
MTAEQTIRLEQKIASAPISWGVCEVPGWGYQLGADRVLKEMREVGLLATELGPEGFLPSEPAALASVLSEHGLLDGSSISLCLDTGHLLIGGTDPAALAGQAPERIAHLHLKDVDSKVAAKVRSGELTYSEAVKQGMYRPLGQGDVDVPTIVGHVQAHGYSGWYTLEQDTILTEEPKDEGPVADVRSSAEYLRTVLGQLP